MNTIFFGPWTGEFGYELSYWIGECRAIRDQYPKYKAVASSYYGRARLYDFVDEFLPHAPNSINIAQDVSMNSGKGVILHEGVHWYLNSPGCVHIAPGAIYGGLKLGGGHGHAQIKESVSFQKPKTLTASDWALNIVDAVAGEKPIISILCRDLVFSGHHIHKWSENSWLKLIQLLQLDGFCVVLLLPGYPSKPSYCLDNNGGAISLWKMYGESENFVDLQIAFLKKSVCSVATVSGAVFYGYLVDVPFIYMLATSSVCYKGLYDIWSEPYENQVRYLFGNGSVGDISVDTCYKEIKKIYE
jgi:hypothetical protein